jgi:hypothetical protein
MKNEKLIVGLSNLLKLDKNVIITELEKEGGDDGVLKDFTNKHAVFTLDDVSKLKTNAKAEGLAELEKATEFPPAIYNRVKGLALEKAEKEIAKKHGVEKWESLEDLTSKIAAKGKGVDSEKDVQIEKLKQALKESEDLAATKVKEVEEKYTNDFATRDFTSAINALVLDGEESAIENQKKLFASAFKSQYKLSYKDGKTIVLDAENKVVTDKVGDPMAVSDIYKSFAIAHGAKIKEVDAGGRGDASSQQQSNNLKGKTFEQVAAAKGVRPMTAEADTLYAEWKAANN